VVANEGAIPNHHIRGDEAYRTHDLRPLADGRTGLRDKVSLGSESASRWKQPN